MLALRLVWWQHFQAHHSFANEYTAHLRSIQVFLKRNACALRPGGKMAMEHGSCRARFVCTLKRSSNDGRPSARRCACMTTACRMLRHRVLPHQCGSHIGQTRFIVKWSVINVGRRSTCCNVPRAAEDVPVISPRVCGAIPFAISSTSHYCMRLCLFLCGVGLHLHVAAC
jgi:hypothetical protein